MYDKTHSSCFDLSSYLEADPNEEKSLDKHEKMSNNQINCEKSTNFGSSD